LKDYDKDYEKDQKPAYERPSVVDYGTLVDITRALNLSNSDSPAGTPNTAFPIHS
jgi:hypothetical protein